MFGENGRDASRPRLPCTNVVNACSRQLPARRLRFLIQGEYMQLMMARQLADQGQQRGNHPIFAGPVHATRNHQGQLYGLQSVLPR